ncbi:hypothetical protein ACQR16_05980 [Bradyrhizobium oligotrophicum]|uniref:hypothetical protein n=1 Tax=Bradyrhizobium oligotrophicum TaxID=44255 RepID=UPI003EBA65B8
MTTPALRRIVLDFEAAALRAVAAGDASDVEQAHEAAIERFRDVKDSCEADGHLEAFYRAVIEVDLKLKMALEAVR